MRAAVATVLLSLGWACGPAVAEPVIPAVSYPALEKHAPAVGGFVPAGWRMELTRSGDLNSDGHDDVVLVLRAADPRNIVDMRGQGGPENYDTNPRILAVAFANAAGRYDLVLENHTLIARPIYPGEQDPLDPNGVQEGGVVIKNGALRVTLGYFGGNMGHKTFTFRFEKTGFRLIGFDAVDVERSRGLMSDVSVNYLTRRVKRTTGHISDDKARVTWIALPQKPLLTVDQIGDGLMFNVPK